MLMNTGFSDLLRILNEYNVKYLLVGGDAVIYYTEPRFTKDINIWIEPTPENAEQVWQALVEFDAPLEQITLDDFQNRELIYQIDIAPNRIDINMDVPDVEFKNAWKKKNLSHYSKVPVS